MNKAFVGTFLTCLIVSPVSMLGFSCSDGDAGADRVVSCNSETFLVDVDGNEQKFPYCIEYTGSKYTNQAARTHCSAQMTADNGVESSFSNEACPVEGILGCCTVLEQSASELKYCFYDAEIAEAVSQSCNGTWIEG